MTNTDKLKVIVEKAGGCWHEFTQPKVFECSHCGVFRVANKLNEWPVKFIVNPSPDSLDDLFALAKLLDAIWLVCRHPDIELGERYRAEVKVGTSGVAATEDTPAEALLNALYSAVKEDV